MVLVTVGPNGSDLVKCEVPAEPSALGPRSGVPPFDGAAVGMPLLAAGPVAFALGVTGFAPVGALVPVLIVITIGMLVAARLAFRMGDALQGVLFTVFGGFWLTYAALIIGLSHNWYGIGAAGTSRAITAFLISWLVIVLMVTIAALAQPFTGFLAFLLLDLALILLIIGTAFGLTGLFTAAGAVLFILGVLGAYMCIAVTGPHALRRVLSLGPTIMGRGSDTRVSQPGDDVEDIEHEVDGVQSTAPSVASSKQEAPTATETGQTET